MRFQWESRATRVNDNDTRGTFKATSNILYGAVCCFQTENAQSQVIDRLLNALLVSVLLAHVVLPSYSRDSPLFLCITDTFKGELSQDFLYQPPQTLLLKKDFLKDTFIKQKSQIAVNQRSILFCLVKKWGKAVIIPLLQRSTEFKLNLVFIAM